MFTYLDPNWLLDNSHFINLAVVYVINATVIVVYVFTVLIALFVMGIHWKTSLGHVGIWTCVAWCQSTDMICPRGKGCVKVECLACLLTDTSDAGSSPHMAKTGFSMMSHDK